MAMWPFGKKNKKNSDNEHVEKPGRQQFEDSAGSDIPPAPEDTAADARAAAGLSSEDEFNSVPHDAINGETGPFDGDSVNINDFDFSEFSTGILDLSSIRIPLPKQSQVQVEMGPNGPKMIHIVTRFGRITPVAFAAPRSAGQWKESAKELTDNLEKEGLDTTAEQGPWGSEIVSQNAKGTIRIIGVEGPRWLLRATLAAPEGMGDDLAELAREMIARMFVYRGEDAILAGNSLPVTVPPELVKQIQKEMERRQQGQEPAAPSAAEQARSAKKNSANHPENDSADGPEPLPDSPEPSAEDTARDHIEQLRQQQSPQDDTGAESADGEDSEDN